jgi:hypothetical protein
MRCVKLPADLIESSRQPACWPTEQQLDLRHRARRVEQGQQLAMRPRLQLETASRWHSR